MEISQNKSEKKEKKKTSEFRGVKYSGGLKELEAIAGIPLRGDDGLDGSVGNTEKQQ